MQLATPTTTTDLKALLYNIPMFQGFADAGEMSSNDFYVTDEDLNSLYYESNKRLYSWQPDHVSMDAESGANNWMNCYQPIYVCNSVLQSLKDNNLSGPEADDIKGQALVLRAARFLDGVQIWAPVYNPLTANTDLGMVLRLDPDMNIPSKRATVQQTYDQIISDLTEAIPLVAKVASASNIPTKASAYGLLARAYLIMGNYELAKKNAEAALQFNANLIDFNTLNSGAAFPIPGTRLYAPEELALLTTMSISELDMTSMIKVNPELYNLYPENDLRKVIYFNVKQDGSYVFKGAHTSYQFCTGVTTAEVMLIIAECNARAGKLIDAANALDKLSVKRWKTGTFIPYAFTDKDQALQIILEERRRELVFRGLRWSDLKRLNRDGANITLTRTINGKVYTLPPNDKRYAIALPEDIVEIANIPQNPR